MAAMPKQHPTAGVPIPDLSTVWLRVFLVVARHGSFTVAARALGWTQSAVSRQISSLEAALGGTPLFDRLPRGVRLTEAGRLLVPHAETVAETLHGAARDLAALRDMAGGRLRFGAFATADAALVPHALAAFRARHPRVRLSREEGLTPGLLDRLGAGHLDLAVVSTTGRAPLDSYELHHLLDESLYVAVPADHPLAGHEGPVRLGQLADADWISGSSRPRGHPPGRGPAPGVPPARDACRGRVDRQAGVRRRGPRSHPGPRPGRRVRTPGHRAAAGARRGSPGPGGVRGDGAGAGADAGGGGVRGGAAGGGGSYPRPRVGADSMRT